MAYGLHLAGGFINIKCDELPLRPKGLTKKGIVEEFYSTGSYYEFYSNGIFIATHGKMKYYFYVPNIKTIVEQIKQLYYDKA